MNISIVGLKDIELSDEERKFIVSLLHDFVLGDERLGEPTKQFGWKIIKKLV